jgi:hypothetical protein
MDRISEHVSAWATGSGGSDCALAGPPPPASSGAVTTLVIAQASLRCDSDDRNFKGIVFHGLEPVAWCCLTSEEVASFQLWGRTTFPTARVITVPEPVGSINCPPPNPQFGVTPREQLRVALRDLAKTWLGQPATVQPTV